jgi:predicted NUDIX family NTP pyrophosphohydrolase
MYRRRRGRLEVFLVHPGGPLWARKDLEAWSVPKGEYAESEQALEAAKRNFLELGVVKQASGKLVSAWAFEGDYDPGDLVSNHCEIEWPPHSGRLIEIPEVDRGEWFSIPEANERILKSQQPFLDRLSQAISPEK